MTISGSVGDLLSSVGIQHKIAQLDGDVLTVTFTRSFLQREDVIPLLEVAGELRTTLILLHFRGVCFHISYLDYIDMLMNDGNLDTFIQRWTVGDSHL